MDIFGYIRLQTANMRHMSEMTLQGMTPELFNWPAPGTANTISATFVHLMSVEDHFVQEIIQDKPSVWQSGNWNEKTGVAKLPRIGEDWSEFKHRQVALEPLLEYKTAVWAATDAYLDVLTDVELERKVKFAKGERTVADILILSVSQSLSHMGEIAALKGVQGAKGLPV